MPWSNDDNDAADPPKTHGDCNCVLIQGVAAASICSVLLGYDIGVISGAIVLVKEEFSLSTEQVEICTSSLNGAAAVGSILGGKLSETLGRKYSMAITSVIFMIGSIVMALSTGMYSMLAGRIVAGIGVGAAIVISPMYIAELVPPSIRGRLVSCNEISINVGILLGYIANYSLLGSANDWRWMLAMGFFIAVLLLLMIIAMPESPKWLALKGRDVEALRVLVLLTGSKKEAKRQLEVSRRGNGATYNESGEQEGVGEAGWDEIWHPTPPVARMLTAGIGIGLLQQITGAFTGPCLRCFGPPSTKHGPYAL
jgi:MFS family permease